jgi:NADPH:quinone reductase-like Zn-dependent oxidoreductase
MVIQLAKEMKVKLVNVVKSSPVIGELKEIGAGAVLLDTDDLRDRITAVTQGGPIKLAFDAIGGNATTRLAQCLSDDGVIVNYGALSGETCQMPSDLLASRGIRLAGINPSRQLARHTPEERKAIYARIGELLNAGKLHARVAATYSLEEAIKALRHALSEGDKRFGKVVLRIKDLPAQIQVPAEPPAESAAAATPAAQAASPAAADAPANGAAPAVAPATAPPAEVANGPAPA